MNDSNNLEDLVIDHFPYPIACCYERFYQADADDAGKFGTLLDTVESLLHYLATVLLSVYCRDQTADADLNKMLVEKFYKGKWAIGDLMEIVRETTHFYFSRPDVLPYPQWVSTLFKLNGRPTATQQRLNEFVTLRNQWAHGGAMDNARGAEWCTTHRPRLEELLRAFEWLKAYPLWLPKDISPAAEETKVTKADTFEGCKRRKNQPVSLVLQPNDLVDPKEVVEERTFLLVDESKSRYWVLFPLSLYSIQKDRAQLFFLTKLNWNKAQITKAAYKAYDSRLEEHQTEQLPVLEALQRKVSYLESLLSSQQQATLIASQPPASGPEYDLPEVWAEQQFHLKTFVGRVDWLQRLQQWGEAATSQGYFLLLGTPGEGKSALLSQFTQQQKEQQKHILVHLVKSHKNPRRFLQFLLWQWQRATGTVLEEKVYQGDIEDLRNRWVGELQKVASPQSPWLIVIDALDELDPDGKQLNFLPKLLPDGVRMILSCRPDIPLVNALRRYLSPLQEERLTPLAAAELPLFLEKYLKLDLPWIENLEGLKATIDFDALFQRMQGNPLLLTRAMQHIVAMVQQQAASSQQTGTLVIDIQQFPNSIEALFADIYGQLTEKRTGGSEAGRIKGRLLQILSLAKEPLSIEELRGVLWAWQGTRLYLDEATELVEQMSAYLLSFANDKFLLFHQGFSDYLHDKVLGKDGMAVVHRAFGQWLSSPSLARSLYRLRHLPGHLQGWGECSQADGDSEQAQQAFKQWQALLCDFAFVQTKVEAGLVYDLVSDYQVARSVLSTVRELEMWESFIDGHSHFLSPHPEWFLQQALNQPPDTPIAQGAERWLEKRPPSRPYLRWLDKPEKWVRSPLLRTLTGHTGSVNSVAISPNNRWIVSGSSDKTIKVWDLANGQKIATLTGHTGWVNAVAVSADNRLVVSGSRDKTLKVWDLDSWQEVATWTGHTEAVKAVAVSADNRRVVSVSWDGTLKVWDLDSRQEVATWTGHTYLVKVSADNRWIVSGSWSETIKVWDLISGQEVATLTGHTEAVTAVAVSADNRYVVTGSWDKTIKVWDLASGQAVATLTGHTGRVSAVAVSADNRRVVSGSSDKTIKVWDLVCGQEVVTPTNHTGWVSAVAVSTDNRWVMSGSEDNTIKVWDLDSGQEVATLTGHTDPVTTVAMSTDNRWVVSGSKDKTIKIWDLARRKKYATLNRWVVSGSKDKTIKIWDLVRRSRKKYATLKGHTDSVTAVAVSADNRLVVSGSDDKTIKVWNFARGQEVATLIGHTKSVNAVAVSADNRWIVSGSDDETIKVWDWSTGQVVATLTGDMDEVSAIAMSRDNRWVVSGSWDKTIKVWDLASGQNIATFPTKSEVLMCACRATGEIVGRDNTGEVYILRLEGV